MEEKISLMELFIKVDRLLQMLQSYQFRAMGPLGNPHRGQGRVLYLLKLQPEISQKELGYLLDMRNQSLGELLGKLEKNGYITRTPSEKDRRTMNIKLTEAGVAAAKQLEQREEEGDTLFRSLTDEEQEVMFVYLERIAADLEKQVEEMGGMDGQFGRFWDAFKGKDHGKMRHDWGGMHFHGDRSHPPKMHGMPPFHGHYGGNPFGEGAEFGERPEFGEHLEAGFGREADDSQETEE